jgi:hypothetical protein
MKLFNGVFAFLRRLSGGILVLAGFVIAYFWFYSLAPMRHLADSKWLETHTEKARWLEEQKDYERMGSSPDLEFRGDRIGYYGDKKWFVWLVNKATTDKGFRVCGCTETALALMCNQHVDSWEEWMKANRNRTQEEWVRDGFLKYGVTVNLPPDASDVEPLLKLMGRKSWNFLSGGPQGTNAPDAIPNYVQYNAFRWLRDSGFKPTAFARSNATLVASQDMAISLLKYANWQSAFPYAERDDLGIFAFAKRPELGAGFAPALITRSWVSWAVGGSVIAFLAMGLWLAVLRKPSKAQTADALKNKELGFIGGNK